MAARALLNRARARVGGRGQHGSATLELVVIFPAVLLLIFGIVTSALWYHGRTLAMLAAQDGLRAAQAYDGTAAAGRSQTSAALTRSGATGFLTGPRITVARTPTQVTVTVTARSMALFPGAGLPITQRATGPVERITEDTP